MKKVTLNKEVDVKKEVDVIVCGGGPAGIGAAIAAARQGMDVALIESRAFLGGNITACNVYRIDPTDADDLTRAEMLARKRVLQFFNFIKEYLPGFEKAELASIAPTMGFRDSRRIKGVYRLTAEDIDEGRFFEDTIAIYPRFYDMLSPTGTWDDLVYIVDLDKEYGIPYRCLLPVNVEQMLVAGRCISTDYMAESSIRAISACMATGQAAGTAAAIAVRDNTNVRDIDVRKVQQALKEAGVRLPD